MFIAPWLIGFVLFTALPMIATFVFTFTNINLAQTEPLQFVGLRELRRRWLGDQQAWTSLGITLKFAALALPVAVVAAVRSSRCCSTRGTSSARASSGSCSSCPFVVPFVATVFIWGGMLNPETGWINAGLEALGVTDPPAWLEDPGWVYPGLALIEVWGIGAGMIVYLAALKGVPTDLYEAARIDGAGAWASPAPHHDPDAHAGDLLHDRAVGRRGACSTSSCRSSSRTAPASPAARRMFYNLYIYKNFFTFQNMSYGATLAWLLFGITLAITLVLFGTARRWVFYAGDAR